MMEAAERDGANGFFAAGAAVAATREAMEPIGEPKINVQRKRIIGDLTHGGLLPAP
jgi:hypothetical protein